MNDSNIEVSYIEYSKDQIYLGEEDADGDTSNDKGNKMPNMDKPPRNQTWSDNGFANASSCNTTTGVDGSTNITEWKYELGK